MKKSLLLCVLGISIATWVSAQRKDDVPTHSIYIKAVDEYVPAPGQFVNKLPEYEKDDTPEKMAEKCTKCLANDQRTLITLGAYGGYVTFHFDHSIANIKGKKDVYIMGNAFSSGTGRGSCEPGIVMVSKDVNGNGKPDDPWYELSGSCDVDSVGKVVYGYELTYTRKDMEDIPWTDNQGNSGKVERNQFHSQEFYPLWLPPMTTFKGTRLPQNGWNIGKSGSQYWVQYFFRYGYVDNKPNSDRDACSFDFDWAVDAHRNPVQIDFVDFIRVYNGMNQMCGWLGETSTEVLGAEDLHLEESLAAIATSINGVTSADAVEVGRYSIDGRKLDAPQRGVNIVRMSDGTVRKVIVK